MPGVPAFHADQRIRDLVVSIAGKATATAKGSGDALRGVPVGDDVAFTVMRDGATLEKTVKVSEGQDTERGYNVLGLLKHRRKPGSRQFGLLWGLLFNTGQ